MSCPLSKLSINHVDIQNLLVSSIHPSLSIHPFPSLLAQLFSIDSGTCAKMAVSKRPPRQSGKVSFEFRAGMMAIATPISLGLSWPKKQIATKIGTGVAPSLTMVWMYVPTQSACFVICRLPITLKIYNVLPTYISIFTMFSCHLFP